MKSYDWISEIKAVGFDLDGTLYRSDPKMSEWIGQQLIDEVLEHVGGDEEEVVQEYERRKAELGSNTKTLDSFGLVGMDIFRKLWNRLPLEKFVKKDLVVASMLKRLREKYSIFLISNGREVEIMKKLKYLEIDPEMFDPLIACYDHDGWVKPNPSSFLAVLEQLKFAPEEVLYVGDRDATDIEGARGVEMKTAMVWGESELADISFESVYDLEKLLL